MTFRLIVADIRILAGELYGSDREVLTRNDTADKILASLLGVRVGGLKIFCNINDIQEMFNEITFCFYDTEKDYVFSPMHIDA